MNTLQANINNDLLKDEEQLACLVEATNEIFTASEKDFEKMKSKKWYNRLWEMITLSKDNEKVVVSNITNLSKLQEIVMKALLQLSDKNTDIAEIIKNHADRLENISNNQYTIVKEIEKLKYGFDREITLQEVNENKKHIIINMFIKFVGFLDKTENEDSQNYINAIVKNLNFSNIDAELPFDMIENLSKDEMRLLYQIMMEYCYIVEDKFIEDFEAFDYLELSGKNKKIVKERIESMTRLIGKHNLKERYEIEEPVWDIDIEGIELSENVEEISITESKVDVDDGSVLVMEGAIVDMSDCYLSTGNPILIINGEATGKITEEMRVKIADKVGKEIAVGRVVYINFQNDTFHVGMYGDGDCIYVEIGKELYQYLLHKKEIYNDVKVFNYIDSKKEKNLLMEGKVINFDKRLRQDADMSVSGTVINKIPLSKNIPVKFEDENGNKIVGYGFIHWVMLAEEDEMSSSHNDVVDIYVSDTIYKNRKSMLHKRIRIIRDEEE